MGYFIRCGHTCEHSGPNAHQLPIFYSVGGSIDNHLKGKVHKNCSSRCRAHPAFSGQGAVVRETLGPDDIKSLADELWKRFDNRKALALIPRKYLKKAKHRNQHRELFSPSSELEDEGNSEDDAPPTEPVAGPSGTTHLNPGPTPIHRLPGGIYENMTEIIKSEFYTQCVTLCLVEDPQRRTASLQEAAQSCSWMVGTNNIPDRRSSYFREAFPMHVFERYGDITQNQYWEWVRLRLYYLIVT
jgi:hypothetical protein